MTRRVVLLDDDELDRLLDWYETVSTFDRDDPEDDEELAAKIRDLRPSPS